MIVVHPGFIVPVHGSIVAMSYELLFRNLTAKRRRQRHGDRVPLDLAGVKALAPRLYRVPVVGRP
ncbi:MAG: hypothetical protein ACRDYA_02750 [Egibacteraceae bacterium]